MSLSGTPSSGTPSSDPSTPSSGTPSSDPSTPSTPPPSRSSSDASDRQEEEVHPSATTPCVVPPVEIPVSGWDSPHEQEEDEMPPLVSDSDQEDQEEDQEEHQEEHQENHRIVPVSQGVPPLLTFLSLLLFLLHLFNYGQLLAEKRQQSSNPCFPFRF